ncbi:MAG TPA: hypothetical protein VFL97_05200 [Nitrococcus sp.]|nr:hypothetical protein [Nitrococcus sp.]
MQEPTIHDDLETICIEKGSWVWQELAHLVRQAIRVEARLVRDARGMIENRCDYFGEGCGVISMLHAAGTRQNMLAMQAAREHIEVGRALGIPERAMMTDFRCELMKKGVRA